MTQKARRAAFGGLAAVVAALVVAAAGAAGARSADDETGYLGLYMQKLDRDVREGLDISVDKGVLVSGVEEGGPADEAGLEDGDVIVEFDSHAVDDPGDLRELVREAKPGDRVELKIVRDGETKTLTVTVGEWPDEPSWLTVGDLDIDRDDLGRHVEKLAYAFRPGPRLGVDVAELNEDLAAYFKAEAGEGVLVLDVADGSVAEEAGVKAGDVIVEVGGEKVASTEELREALEDYDEGDEFDVVVLRRGKKKTLKATMDEIGQFRWSGAPGCYSYRMPGVHRFTTRLPRVKVEVDRNVRDEIRELKKELKAMKKEIEELKK